MSLKEVFELPTLKSVLNYKNVLIYSIVDEDGDTVQEGFKMRELFKDKEDVEISVNLFVRMIDYFTEKGDHTFGYLERLCEYIAGKSDSDPKMLVETCLMKLEGYLKSIVYTAIDNGPELIRQMEARKQALNYLIKEIGDRADSRFYDPKAHPLFESLRFQRNEEAHALHICCTHDVLAKHILVALLHVVSFVGQRLGAAITRFENGRLTSGADAGAADESESQAALQHNYVKHVYDDYKNYLRKVVGVGSTDEMMPVKIVGYRSKLSVDAIDLPDVDESISVVLGAPGAGKTTMLNAMLLRAAERYLESDADDEPMPVMLSFKSVSHGDTFYDLLYRSFRHINVPDRVARDAFADGRLIIALDGLNEFEVDKASIHDFLKGMFGAMVANPGNRYILTGRIYEFASVSDLVRQYADAGMYEMQGVTMQMLADFIGRQKLPVAVKTSLYALLEKPEAERLLTSPLNFSAVMSLAKDGREFNVDNRGLLMQAFVGKTKVEDDKIRKFVLRRLARYIKDKGGTGVGEYEFMSALAAEEPAMFRDIESIDKCLQSIKSAGIIEISGGIISFKIDTYREYFVAKRMAEQFAIDQASPGVDLGDENDFETLRMMIEVLGRHYQRRRLAEKLYEAGSGERPVADISSAPGLDSVSPLLVPVARLVCTLPKVIDEKGEPGAKALVEGWVLNHLRVLKALRGRVDRDDPAAVDRYHAVLFKVVEAAAILSTREVYLKIFDPDMLAPLAGSESRHIGRMAGVLVDNCSDTFSLYEMLSEAMLNMGMVPSVYSLATECRKRFFNSLSPISLEQLHRSIAAGLGESRRDYAVKIRDYFQTALLKADPAIIRSLEMDRILACKIKLNFTVFNRLLQRLGNQDVVAALFDDKLMRYYETSHDTFYYILKYLIFHGAADVVARRLASSDSVRLLSSRLRTVCNLLPAGSLPEKVASKLYNMPLLRMIADAGDADPWASLRLDDDSLAGLYRHNKGLYLVPKRHSDPVVTFDYDVIGFDREGNISVLTLPVREPSALDGREVQIYCGKDTSSARILSCRPFESDYCDLILRVSSGRNLPLKGRITWHNKAAKAKNHLRYAYAGRQDGNHVRVRITDPIAVGVLRTPRWQELIMSPSTELSVDNVRVVPVATRLYVEHGDCSQVTFAAQDAENVLKGSKFQVLDAEGKREYVGVRGNFSASNEPFDCFSIIALDPAAGTMAVAVDPAGIEYAEAGLWLSRLEADLHVRITRDSRRVAALASCGRVRLNRVIPLHGMAVMPGLDSPVEYYGRSGDAPGVYSLTFLTDDAGCDAVASALVQYADIEFADVAGEGRVNTVIQEIDEVERSGEKTIVDTDFVHATESDVADWLADDRMMLVKARVIDNRKAVEPSRYKTDCLPYTAVDGDALVPQPDKTVIFSDYTVIAGRSGLECRVTSVRAVENERGRFLRLRLARLDTGLKPGLMRSGDVLRLVPRGEETALPVYSRLLPFIDFDNPEACHSSVAAKVYNEIVAQNLRVDERIIRFFKALGMVHLLVADGRFDDSIKAIRCKEPLVSTAVVTARPTDVVWYMSAGFKNMSPDAQLNSLHAGDLVVVENSGRVVKIERDLPACPALGLFTATAVGQTDDGSVKARRAGKDFVLTNLSGAHVPNGTVVRYIANAGEGKYIMCNLNKPNDGK